MVQLAESSQVMNEFRFPNSHQGWVFPNEFCCEQGKGVVALVYVNDCEEK